jgi:formylglycine-generating enzyme required for sulfatase activity
MEFIMIPAGAFTMGANPEMERSESNELSPHHVNITNPFYNGKYEVTQERWQTVMNDNHTENFDKVTNCSRFRLSLWK